MHVYRLSLMHNRVAYVWADTMTNALRIADAMGLAYTGIAAWHLDASPMVG